MVTNTFVNGTASAALELTFNLATTDTSVTPLLRGYGVFVK